jgi:hypothetical protein
MLDGEILHGQEKLPGRKVNFPATTIDNKMDSLTGFLTVAMAMLASSMLGAAAYARWQQRVALAKRRIPRKWPMTVRTLVNSKERLAWRWLTRSFLDHHVMVKTPITRFTMPQFKEDGQRWFHILSDVYCTFTVCDTDGNVIGCIDVPGPGGLSLSNQTLKHTLLSQCNIHYWVVDPDELPSTTLIRATFLGEHAALRDELARVRTDAEFNETRASLKAALLRQRHHHASDLATQDARPAAHSPGDDSYDSHLSTGWQQNSFVAPLDSRRAELH